MATSVTPSDLKEAYPGNTSKSDSRLQAIIDRSERLADSIYSGQIGREGEQQGDRDDFIELLSLHRLTLEEGGEKQSESQTGGTTNFAHATPEDSRGLHQTRWGREALIYLRDESSFGVELV